MRPANDCLKCPVQSLWANFLDRQCFANFLFCGNSTLAQIAIFLHFSSVITRHSPKLASRGKLFVARFDEKLQGKQSVSKLCCLLPKRKLARHLSEISYIPISSVQDTSFGNRGANQTCWHEVLEALKQRFAPAKNNLLLKRARNFLWKATEDILSIGETHKLKFAVKTQSKN